jgi:hypothetical protein
MTYWGRLLPTILTILVLIGHVPTGGSEPARSAKKAKPKRPVAVTAEQKEEVMRFLRRHHAELADLLEHLQSSSPSGYNKAIRDLWKAREWLMQIKQRDRARYELELEAWVVESNIQLLVARLAMKDDNVLREELRSLLGRRVDIKLRLLLGERERHLERLRKLDEQVDRYNTGRSEMIEKQFKLLTDSCKRLKQKRADLSAKRITRPSEPTGQEGEP